LRLNILKAQKQFAKEAPLILPVEDAGVVVYRVIALIILFNLARIMSSEGLAVEFY
jgi:hypothetical protein